MMKKIAAFLMIAILFTSCATVFGGPIQESQKVKPINGSRSIRPVPFIADLLFFTPLLAVDFITGAIYKPSLQ